MSDIELAWLQYAYDMMRDDASACACEPYTNGGFRWPGYIGSSYRGVLFVGARHNANGLRKAGLNVGPLHRYATELRRWIAQPRSPASDQRILDAMRSAYRHSYDVWAKDSVWRIFSTIRDSLGPLTWDDVASVNLARCYKPSTNTGEDDNHIVAHAQRWPLDRIVKVLKPRIVFISKHKKHDEELYSALQIDGEAAEQPLVVRYSNHGTGMRHGEHYSAWVPREGAKWRTILAT